MLDLKKDSIPERLKKNDKWVGFTITPEGKKVPIDPKPNSFGGYAKINDPATWGSFEDAVKTVEVGLCVAVGYALTKEDGLIFVDLDCHTDKCKTEEEKEKLEKLYKSLCKTVSYFDTYMEQSLSGEGVHLLAEGSLADDLARGSSPISPIEIYDDKRFIIVTGHRLNDFDIESNDRTIGAIRNLHKIHFPKANTHTSLALGKSNIPISPDQKYSDKEVLEVALREKNFNLLWHDSWDKVVDKEGKQKYTQQHFADFALIRKLTFYTCNCPSQVERLYRSSPTYQAYGKNGKWSKFESDIRKDIEKASSTCSAVYSPLVKTVGSGEAEVVEGEPAPSAEWKPNFQEIYKLLSAEDEESKLFKNPVLVTMLKDYIVKFSGRTDIRYIPYLFKEDRNINGATHIVKQAFGENLKYSFKFGGYYIWDGKRYVNYGDSEVLIHPITEVLGLVEHSVFHWVMTYVVNSENKDFLEDKAIRLFEESKKYVTSKLAQDVLKKYKGMNIGNDISSYYDSPYINLENGVLNLDTKELLSHDPIYNQNKITNCSFDPQATCPEFEAMMERLIPDAAVRKELQKAFGLCLAKEQLPAKKVLMLLVGPKDTGKTTVLNAIIDVLGEYGTSVDNFVLMQNSKDKSRGPEMYDFRETLMITTSESNENDKLDTGRVKALTGETMQSVRNNYATKMDKFRMIGLIFIDSNFKPYIPPRDTATWGRLRLFPFVSVIKEKDPTLKSKLVAEKSGIFNWVLHGLNLVLEEKEIFETPSMLEYKEQYQKEMDTTEQFLKDCVESVEDQYIRIPTTVLFTTYKSWCKDNGFRDSVRNKFYEEVNKTFEKKKSGIDYYINIKFTDLGYLYSTMGEISSQDFAKKKRKLLEGSRLDLPYSVLRSATFIKGKEWFYKVDKDTDKSYYPYYCSWCAARILAPLTLEDFVAKVEYIKSKLDSKTGFVSNDLIDSAKDIWSDIKY